MSRKVSLSVADVYKRQVDESGNPTSRGMGLRELNTADFLSRDEVQLNNAQISEYLHDKVVLVTGGGGSIGSELCRQIIRYRPRQLLIFDIYENCAYELEMELDVYKRQAGRGPTMLICPTRML